MSSLKKERPPLSGLVKYFYFGIAFLVAALIVFKSIDYLHPDFSRGFLFKKQDVFDAWFKYALYTHMTFAPLTIFSGILQFTLTRRSTLHRILGYVYMTGVFFGAISGVCMALHSVGGIWSGLSFTILACLWFWFTVKAFTSIRAGDMETHRINMTRSFILANSAIALRLLAFIFNQYTVMDHLQAYVLISWLCWVPSLLYYEIIRILRKRVVFQG